MADCSTQPDVPHGMPGASVSSDLKALYKSVIIIIIIIIVRATMGCRAQTGRRSDSCYWHTNIV